MSTLLVDELYSGKEFNQPVKIDRSINVVYIRPWIYKQGQLQSGELVVEVYDGATKLAESSLSYTEINEGIPANYAHGFIRMQFDSLILRVPEGQLEKEYLLKFYMNNHVTNFNNFIGIVRRWEAKTYPTYGPGVVDGEAVNDFIEPAGLEIFNYRII